MIRYVENRQWMLNATITDTNRDEAKVDAALRERLVSGIFADGGLRFSYSRNPLGNYSDRPMELRLDFAPNALATFQAHLDERSVRFHVESFQAIIDTFGFLNLKVAYRVLDPLDPEKPSAIESNGDASAEVIDSVFEDLSSAVDALHELGLLRKSPFYHFGTPADLEKLGLHTPYYSYNYTINVFFHDEPESLRVITRAYGCEDASMNYDGVPLHFVFPFHFWAIDTPAASGRIDELISIGSYTIAETAICNTSLLVYNAFLQAINQSRNIDSESIRRIVNHNTWLLQKLRLYNPNFTLFQFKYFKLYREHSDLVPKYELLKNAESSLTFAIEGVEVQATRQSERVMQFILALFTALTLYSVTTDIYALVTSDVQKIPFSLHSLQSMIFLVETLVVASFIYAFNKMSKKL